MLRAVNCVQIALQHLRGHHARNEASDPGKAVVHEVRAAEAEAQAVHHGDVAAGAPAEDDGLGAVLGLNAVEVLLHQVIRLIPADTLPFIVLASELPCALHGIQKPARVLDDLRHGQAAHAQSALVVRVLGVALDLDQVALLVGVAQNAAAVMAAGCRPSMAAGHREVTLLPFARHLPRLVINVSRKLHSSLLSYPSVLCLSGRWKAPRSRPGCRMSLVAYDSRMNQPMWLLSFGFCVSSVAIGVVAAGSSMAIPP